MNTCFVIGNGAIALKSLEILLQSKWTVLGVYSDDGSLQHCAHHAASRQAFAKQLNDSKYDYLFSINNDWILPPEVINSARQATINYHNSLLPKYAGLHAPSWALLHGESEHGISWHEVVTEIDAGKILKQIRLPIQLSDTALSLNARCFEAAITGFTELVTELAANTVQPSLQNSAERSYFGRYQRPPAAGLLAFDQDVATLYNLVRALDFGPTQNLLGLPKLWLPAGVVAVGGSTHSGVYVLDLPPKAQPGEVLGLDETGLWVAALKGSLRFSCLTTLAGEPLSANQLRHDYGVQVGEVLPSLSSEMRQAITNHYSAICRYEQQWVEHLAQLVPFVHPYLGRAAAKPSVAKPSAAKPPKERALQRYPIANSLDAKALLAAFAAYCIRLAAEPKLDLALQTEAQCSIAPDIFAQQVPIRIEAPAPLSFTQFQQQFQTALDRANRCRNYALDVAARYPDLRKADSSLPTTLVLATTPTALNFSASIDAAIGLVAYLDGSPPELVHGGSLSLEDSQSVVRQLEALIAACEQNPQQPLHTLPLLSDLEQQQMLIAWNATTKPCPDRAVHQLVTEQAIRTPEASAVRFQQTQLSYRELDQRSNQLAHWLRQQGIRPNQRVALCLPRSIEMMITVLGILKAGATYVPIDPTYPSERIAYLLSDSHPAAVISLTALNVLQTLPSTIPVLDFDQQAIAKMPTVAVALEATPKLAYIIYTSGSTGKPKGVEISHRALVNHSWAMADLYQLSGEDRVLQSASISFDIAAEQIYPALFRGAEIILRPDDLMESFYRFSMFVAAEAVTVLILPTAFWHEWVADLVSRGETAPTSLRAIAVGTESVQTHRLIQWQQLSNGQVDFFQGYGPTEATITCTVYRHQPSDVDQGTNQTAHQPAHQTELPIGRPLPNTEIYILDAQLQPVPIGIIGELYVGGVALAQGYHQKPELTDERFIPHPFRMGERLYKTGDLARFQPDGQIIYCGRCDDQIKLRGFRIELGEVETVIAQFSGVRQAVVQADTGRLLAYVVLEANLQTASTESFVAQLQAFLRQQLPDYMLPASVMVLDALPLMPNGKVDRRALPKPTPPKPQVAVGDPVERQLMQVWKSLLGVEPTSITDNFFELGGSSLTAVRLADQIQSCFDRQIPLAAIFKAPTVAQLAEMLRSDPAKTDWSSLVPIQTEGARPPLFLFQGVEIYYPLVAHLAPDQPVYGLSLEMVDQNQVVSSQVEQLAARYLKDLRVVQPHGPYLLGGLSFGGAVALEVAQQLQAEGETVALLTVLDTAAPGAFTPKPLAQRFIGHLQNLLKYKLGYVSKKLTGIAQRTYLKLTERFNFERSHTEQHLLLEAVYQRLAEQYEFRPYSGRVALFLATDRSAIGGSICDPALSVIDPEFGWGKYVKDLAVYQTPGNHVGILREPQVRFLAKQLQNCLDEAVYSSSQPPIDREAHDQLLAIYQHETNFEEGRLQRI